MVGSYRSAFLLVFTALMVITVVSVSSNAYRRAADITLDLSSDILGELSENIINRTIELFDASNAYLQSNAELFTGPEGELPQERALRLFWRQLALQPQLMSIYKAGPGGVFLQVSRQPRPVTRVIVHSDNGVDDRLVYRDADYQPIARLNGGGMYDPRTSGWYQRAIEAGGEVVWSPVYRFEQTGKLGVTAARAVFDGDALRQVLGIDIALEDLTDFLAEQSGRRGALAFIVDERDRLVAYPHQLILNTDGTRDAGAPDSMEQLVDRWLVDGYRELLAQTTGAGGDGVETRSRSGRDSNPAYALFSSGDDMRYLAQLRSFPGQWSEGWKLFVVVPESSLLSSASRLISESIAISVIILVGAVLLVQILAFRLFEPMRRLVHNTELIQQLRLDEVEPVNSRFSEIRAMDQAICGMRSGLQELAKFVPAKMARDFIQQGKSAELGGEMVELTLFYSSISKFNALCNQRTTEEVTALVSLILDRFTQVISRTDGTVDNYLGESILAFWGAPSVVIDGPARACRVALQCKLIEDQLRQRESERFPPETVNLFAIHSGRAIVGNFGSKKRMSYTAVGDNVEIGWILKQLNHRYGTQILISEPVQAEVSGLFWLRLVDYVPLYSGAEPTAVYELAGQRSEPMPTDWHHFTERYEEGLAALFDRRWTEAEPIFSELAELRPEDKSVQLMLLRCYSEDAQMSTRLAGTEI
jgi:adenylate cyclase